MIRGGYWGGSWGLSWAGAWGEAWFLLNQPYQELSLKGQVFVRSYLTSIHSAEIAEQIVSVAALNNISVIDAEVVVTAKLIETRVDASNKPITRKIVPPAHDDQIGRTKPHEPIGKYTQQLVFSRQYAIEIHAESVQRNLVVTKRDEPLVLISKQPHH